MYNCIPTPKGGNIKTIIRAWFCLAGLALCLWPCEGIADDIRLHIQDNNLYVSTSFTNQFMFERLGPDMEWERVSLFTELQATPMEWFRAIRIDGPPAALDDAIIFTPGALHGQEAAALPSAPGPWTLIRQDISGDNGIYGPLLDQNLAMEEDPPVAADLAPAAILFWQSTEGETVIWRLGSTGVRISGTFVNTNVVALPLESSGPWVFGGMTDISGDGRPEIFWAMTNGTMKTWFLNTNLQFQSEATMYGSYCPPRYQFRTAGKGSIGNSTDPNLDDLFWQDIEYGYIDTWHMNTNGALRIALPTEGGSIDRAWQLRCSGDINGDGRVELFFHHVTNRTTMTWFLDADGVKTVTNTMFGAIAEGWNMRCAGDVNGDGLSEIFWQHDNGGTAVWFLNTNGVATVGRRIYSRNIATGWRMVAAIDVDGDNLSELIWHHTNGSTAIWFLNTNGTLKSSRRIATRAVASKWKLLAAYSVQSFF